MSSIDLCGSENYYWLVQLYTVYILLVIYTHTQTQSAMDFSKRKRSTDPLVEQAKRPHLIDACEGSSSPYNSPAQSTGSSCSGVSVDGKYRSIH